MSRRSRTTIALGLAAALAALGPGRAPAQESRSAPAATAAREIPLYPGAAPGSEKWDWSERSGRSPRTETDEDRLHETRGAR